MSQIQIMDVKRQHEMYAEEYEEAVLRVMRSGQYIGGEEVSLFEREFAEYNGSKYGVSCGNGTDALVLALKALGIGVGDEVITVPFTFFATAESIAAVGATPVFVDVCPDTYCINTKMIESVITDRTKVILPVNLYGHAADMDEINRIAKKHNLHVVVDCAQSTGTRYKGERKLALGEVSCFSFFPTKNLGCAGDGGMIVTDNEAIANACRALKAHGSGICGLKEWERQLHQQGKEIPKKVLTGESKYYNYLVGYNSRLDSIQAAILRRKLSHLEEFIDGRRRNAKLYTEALVDTEYGIPYEAEDCYHSYYIFAITHKEAKNVMKWLEENEIGCGVYYPVPLHLQGAFADLGYSKGDFPVSERLCETTFAIPIYPELSEEDRRKVISVLKEYRKVEE